MDGPSKIIVDGLAGHTTLQSFIEYFSQFGEVEEGDVEIDGGGSCAGFGFVRYSVRSGGTGVVLATSPHVVDGAAVQVKGCDEAPQAWAGDGGALPNGATAQYAAGGDNGVTLAAVAERITYAVAEALSGLDIMPLICPDVSQHPIQGGGGDKPVCKHFQMNRCTYGGGCRFSHGDANHAEAAAGATAQAEHITAMLASAAFAGAQLAANGAHQEAEQQQQLLQHQQQQQQQVHQTMVMQQHKQQHPTLVMHQQKQQHPTLVMQPATATPRHRGPKSATPCRHNLQGRCTFGDACSFSHDSGLGLLDELAAPPALDTLPPMPRSGGGSVCRHFIQGRCQMGAACRFSHELPEGEAADGSQIGAALRSSPY